ncbi:hypothetical protein EDB87DRAFT_1578102 [Lactarius vividus]|nr:hypothetical protein EDB87DRAFT_1578102 [Lactarius vividus]
MSAFSMKQRALYMISFIRFMPDDHHAPSPALFITHEMRVRACYPFAPLDPDMPKDSPWQDWIESDASTCGPVAINAAGTSSGSRTLELNADVVADILAVSRAMPS